MKKTPIPKNDAEANVLTYRAMEEPLRKAYKHYSDATAKGMLTKIENVLTSAGYDGTNRVQVINRPANPSTLRTLEQMIEGISDEKTRRKCYSKLYGQVGTGSLSVKNAIRDITEFGQYDKVDQLYLAGKAQLGDVAREGMLRGEFMIQKQVGVAWTTRTPGIKQVDSFLSKRWTYNDVVEYMQPLSKIVEEQVSTGLLLGEGPAKIAQRMKNVAPINDIRANRNARTLTNAVANDAHAESYKKHGVKKYEFVATFDERTCSVCGSLDGNTYPLDKKSVGSNYPPLHPNCRCTTVAALSKEIKEKLYKNFEVHNKDGTVDRIDANTTYEDWYNTKGPGRSVKKGGTGEKFYKTIGEKELLPNKKYYETISGSAFYDLNEEGQKAAFVREFNELKEHSPRAFVKKGEYKFRDVKKVKTSHAGGGPTDDERHWIYEYTNFESGWINRNLYDTENKAKRVDQYADVKKDAYKHLDSYIANTEMLEPARLYRGVGTNVFSEGNILDHKDELVGKEFFVENYQSCSTSVETAEGFAKYTSSSPENKIVIEYDVPPGKGIGAYVEDLTANEGESEFLMHRGSYGKILSINKDEKGFVRVKARYLQ